MLVWICSACGLSPNHFCSCFCCGASFCIATVPSICFQLSGSTNSLTHSVKRKMEAAYAYGTPAVKRDSCSETIDVRIRLTYWSKMFGSDAAPVPAEATSAGGAAAAAARSGAGWRARGARASAAASAANRKHHLLSPQLGRSARAPSARSACVAPSASGSPCTSEWTALASTIRAATRGAAREWRTERTGACAPCSRGVRAADASSVRHATSVATTIECQDIARKIARV